MSASEPAKTERLALVLAFIAFVTVILSIALTEDDDLQYANAGLEECVINNLAGVNGSSTYTTIWVKDCVAVHNVLHRKRDKNGNISRENIKDY